MSERSVGLLYDALRTVESRRRRDRAYPVHKKLRFADLGTGDIYDWIIDQIDMPDHGHALDAGCGVGFGALKLARRSSCQVTGISLSAKEIGQARHVAERNDLARRVDFRQGSFDDLPTATYDLVVAVESLKHSFDLSRSLRSIVGSLRSGGQLVIVDDLLVGEERTERGRRVTEDWGLERLYREEDFAAALGNTDRRFVDLSGRVPRRGTLSLAVRLALLRLLMPFAGAVGATALRAYRGGLYLEQMYAAHELIYKAIFYRKAETTRR